MNELRKDETLTTADIANPERSGVRERDDLDREAMGRDRTDREELESDAPPRRVIMDERQQPLPEGQQMVGEPTNRRVVESEVLYQGPASDADLGTMSGSRPQSGSAVNVGSGAAGAERSAAAAAGAERRVAAAPNAGPTRGNEDPSAGMGPLFPADELKQFRSRWDQVQASFVDEPRRAVEEADNLVATVVKRIAEQFAEQRSKLESQWDHGEDATTEDLRLGLRRYRAFFDRLLSM
jgi:hypothetical protein